MFSSSIYLLADNKISFFFKPSDFLTKVPKAYIGKRRASSMSDFLFLGVCDNYLIQIMKLH
jgi:hypothetical protein